MLDEMKRIERMVANMLLITAELACAEPSSRINVMRTTLRSLTVIVGKTASDVVTVCYAI